MLTSITIPLTLLIVGIILTVMYGFSWNTMIVYQIAINIDTYISQTFGNTSLVIGLGIIILLIIMITIAIMYGEGTNYIEIA